MILKNIRKRSKIFSILFSLILFNPTAVNVYACVYGSENEELRYMLFNPDLLNNKSWWSFFYNGKLNYLEGQVKGEDDETIIAKEWIKEMKINVSLEDAKSCLFGGLNDSLLSVNPFYKELQKRPEFKAYYEYARQVETLCYLPLWEDDIKEKKEKEKILLNPLKQSLEEKLKNSNSFFFQKKYAFQLLKLSYYSPDLNLFNRIYNSHFKNIQEKSVLDWWAMHYKSEVLEQEQKFDSANYFHALVFSNSSNKMFVSKQYFSKKNLENILSLAQNDKERADIYLLSEIINPGRSIDGIKKVIELFPSHKHIPLLISREVNKLEDWLGTTKYAEAHIATDFWGEKTIMENWQSDFNYLSEFITSLESMTSLSDNWPDFYNLSLAYLCLIKSDSPKAEIYLSKIHPSNEDFSYQYNILKLIKITIDKDIKDNQVQNEIGEIYKNLIDQREKKFESQKQLYSISLYLRYIFAQKNMIHLAGLFNNYAVNKFCYTCNFYTFEYSLISYYDQYASRSDIEKVIALYYSNSKNKLEQVLLKPYSNPYFFFDVLSAKYIRKGDIKSAMLTLQKIPDQFWYSYYNATYYLDNDPFLSNNELLNPTSIVSYNKREIIEKMFQLEQEANIHPDKRSKNYLQLANAWYNFTDNSWFMISYGQGSATPDDQVYEIAYSKALEYYKKALDYETSKENQAKILYMITVLTDNETMKSFAKKYELLNDTEFYRRKNCLTLKDLANS